MKAPFDATLPSPILPLLELRSDGEASVVPVGGPTSLQTRSYRAGMLDAALTALASEDPPPHAIFTTGSAGSGKSAAVEVQRFARGGLYSQIIEDATHSDSPSLDQADALGSRLAPLAEGAERPARPILIAANTGMLLRLFEAWRPAGHFLGLEAATLGPLGLSEEPVPPDLRVTVLNLDDRPTAGPGGLLGQLLPQLDPDDPAGVMAGSARCGTCTVRAWCTARTNATLVSGPAADALGRLASASAQERGRHDSPRAIWDWLSRIIAPPEAFTGQADPCQAVADAARAGDHGWRLRNLLPETAFRAAGDLGRRIGSFDPSLGVSERAYQIVSSAGIDPVEDADRLDVLACLEPRAEALASAAADCRAGSCTEPDLRVHLARTGTGSALLAQPDAWPLDRDQEGAAFSAALAAYSEWQGASARGLAESDVQAIESRADAMLRPVVQNLGEGLARLFGVFVEGRPFLPLRSYDARDRSRIHVGVDIDLNTVRIHPDPQTERNSAASQLLGHQPLAIRLQLGDGPDLNLDLPAFRLLLGARLHGLAAASQSDERFHALRRAAESLARVAAEVPDAQLLAEEDGRSFLISRAPSLGRQPVLRTRAVVA